MNIRLFDLSTPTLLDYVADRLRGDASRALRADQTDKYETLDTAADMADALLKLIRLTM